jgi:predicted phosphoadenosine phosphosulfate sulfurtransferase
MVNKALKKKYIDTDVYTKAKERIRLLYDRFDDVIVSFSGGKDSTAMLLCTIEVARELGKLPVTAFFYDEEAIHPETVDYVRRVYNDPDVDLKWFCLPVQHRNACSNSSPFWHPWHPEERHLWVRDLPPEGILTHPAFKFGQSMQEFGLELARMQRNKVIIQGIRTEESLRRYRAVAIKKTDNFISKPDKGVTFAYPIYDWSSKDVWKLVQVKNADYNRAYDVFNRTDKFEHFLTQRVCPPFGEEPLRGLYQYAQCWPELWSKMIHRVPGAATAARYANTELYSTGYKPEQVSWRDHVENMLETYDPENRKKVAARINSFINYHKSQTDEPIPHEQPHVLSGLSWKFISKVVTRGDFKGRQDITKEAVKALAASGLTMEQAKMLHGKKGQTT